VKPGAIPLAYSPASVAVAGSAAAAVVVAVVAPGVVDSKL
jgi:hypothetical protein